MEEYRIEGIVFSNEDEYQKALLDQKNIELVRAKYEYTDAKTAEAVYQKLIRQNIFKTILGDLFLKELQDIIQIGGGNIESLPPILARETTFSKGDNYPVEEEIQSEKSQKALGISLTLNVILFFLLILFYLFTKNSDNANITNYERVISKKYQAIYETSSKATEETSTFGVEVESQE